jgi:hypothetical protein
VHCQTSLNTHTDPQRVFPALSNPPDAEAAAIGELYRQGKTSLVDSIKRFVEAGQKLIAKKAALKHEHGHGSWLAWLRDNAEALGFESRMTASRLMRLASNVTPALHIDEVGAYTGVLEQHRLAPGEVGHVLTISPTRDQANIVKDYCAEFIARSPVLASELDGEPTANEIRLRRHDVAIATHPCSFRSVRGSILDEVAFFRDESSAVPDVEIYRGDAPTGQGRHAGRHQHGLQALRVVVPKGSRLLRRR